VRETAERAGGAVARAGARRSVLAMALLIYAPRMRALRTGDEAELSWSGGGVGCQVVAAAGAYVLLRPERETPAPELPVSLTYLDGRVPMGWDGAVRAGAHEGELIFSAGDGRTLDRRSAVRVPVMARLRLTVGDRVVDAQVLDVSAGGMRFRQPGRLPPSTPVNVRVSLPDDLVIDAEAVVRTSEPGISSVEFTEMRAADAQTIGAWTVGVLRRSLAGLN
jgi:hypothetical protein